MEDQVRILGFAGSLRKIDQTGRIIDEKTRTKVADLLEALVLWTRKLSSPQYAQRGDYY